MDSSEFVESKWRKLCESLELKERATSKWWDIINNHYAEPWRHYHTLHHLSNMLSLLQQNAAQNSKNLVLAIYFHDVIYNPQRQDNEEQSAVLFNAFFSECLLGGSGHDPQKVVDMILLTKFHHTRAHEGQEFGTEDEHYLLDLDMSILGQSWNTYAQYAMNIRKEYCHIPLHDYCSKRSQLLSSFLNSPRIFCTKEFNHKYEKEARHNIEQEIGLLSLNTIPTPSLEVLQ